MSILNLQTELLKLTYSEMMEVAEALRDRLCDYKPDELSEPEPYAASLADFAENHNPE